VGWFSTRCVTNRFDKVMAFPLSEHTKSIFVQELHIKHYINGFKLTNNVMFVPCVCLYNDGSHVVGLKWFM
jgi:hypothetical protein